MLHYILKEIKVLWESIDASLRHMFEEANVVANSLAKRSFDCTIKKRQGLVLIDLYLNPL